MHGSLVAADLRHSFWYDDGRSLHSDTSTTGLGQDAGLLVLAHHGHTRVPEGCPKLELPTGSLEVRGEGARFELPDATSLWLYLLHLLLGFQRGASLPRGLSSCSTTRRCALLHALALPVPPEPSRALSQARNACKLPKIEGYLYIFLQNPSKTS